MKGGNILIKNSSYYKKQIDSIKQKLDDLKRKRKNLKYGKINKRILYQKLEQRYKYKLDKYLDLYLYRLGKEALLKSSKESQQLYEKMQVMRKKFNRVGKKKNRLKWYKFNRKKIYNELQKVYSQWIMFYFYSYKDSLELDS